MSSSLWPHGLQQARLPCPSSTPGVYSNSCPLSRWCHPIISSSVIPFSSHLQSFPASGSFQMSQFFASGGQRIGVSASASVLPMNIQDWYPLGWVGWISLLSKGLSRVFSNTTVQKHQLSHQESLSSSLPCPHFYKMHMHISAYFQTNPYQNHVRKLLSALFCRNWNWDQEKFSNVAKFTTLLSCQARIWIHFLSKSEPSVLKHYFGILLNLLKSERKI